MSRTQFQYSLQDGDIDELNTWAPRLLAKLPTLPELTGVASDQQNNGATVTLKIDRDQASRLGISPALIDNTLYDAFGQRQVTQYFTQLNGYHVILELLPELQASPQALNEIYLRSPLTGEQVPLCVLIKCTTEPASFLSINHQSQFPAVTLSLQSRAWRGAGPRGHRDPQGRGRARHAGDAGRHVPGQCAGVPGSRLPASPCWSPRRCW